MFFFSVSRSFLIAAVCNVCLQNGQPLFVGAAIGRIIQPFALVITEPRGWRARPIAWVDARRSRLRRNINPRPRFDSLSGRLVSPFAQHEAREATHRIKTPSLAICMLLPCLHIYSIAAARLAERSGDRAASTTGETRTAEGETSHPIIYRAVLSGDHPFNLELRVAI